MGRRERKPGDGWRLAGTILAVTVAVTGLVALGVAIFFAVALTSWANNK
jgi:hypothetical protein